MATSQQNAKQLERKSNEASTVSQGPASSASAAATTSRGVGPAAAKPSAHAGAPATRAPRAPARPGSPTSIPHLQGVVEAELRQGKVVLLLFWNPRGADDRVTHRSLGSLAKLHKTVAVHEGPAGSVAQYGTITRGVQVGSTPTVLIVNKAHKASTLTGAVDAYGIEQAIQEARAG